jgi:hypothetical protein
LKVHRKHFAGIKNSGKEKEESVNGDVVKSARGGKTASKTG